MVKIENAVIYWVCYCALGWGVKGRRAQIECLEGGAVCALCYVQTIECLILLSKGIAETIWM